MKLTENLIYYFYLHFKFKLDYLFKHEYMNGTTSNTYTHRKYSKGEQTCIKN